MRHKKPRRMEKPGMNVDEIRELLNLRGWSKTELAARMKVTENTVHKWFAAGHAPEGPASVLLGEWLARARNENLAEATA